MDAPKKGCKIPFCEAARVRCDSAFTLIEVTMAILILASALVVLLGMQSSLLGLSIADRQRQEAMLLARRILSAIEIAQDQSPGEKSGDGRQMLEEFVDTKGLNDQDLEHLRNFMVYLRTSAIGIPGIADDAMYRLSLSVAWGDAPQDKLEVLYFEPNISSSDEAEAQIE